jgi:hypothetical protein
MDDARGRRDRGQILLISGLLLAVLFVGLAVVVNSAVYAENQATREVTRSSEPLADHPVTQERVSQAVHDVNLDNDTARYGPRHEKLADNVSDWDSRMQGKEAANGALFGAAKVNGTNGTRISQEVNQQFRPSGDEYWTEDLLGSPLDPLGAFDRMSWLVAPGVRSRGYEATVNRTALKDTTNTLSDVVDWVLNGNDAFGIVFDNGAKYRTVYMVEVDQGDDNENDIAAVVSEENTSVADQEDYVGHCRVEAPNATIRLDDNELEGNGTTVDCPVLSFTEDLGRHDIYYVGANNVKGTYDLIVDKNKSTFDAEIADKYDEDFLEDVLGLTCLLNIFDTCGDTTVYEDPGNGHPYTTWAIWNSTAELTYQDDRVRYSRNVTVPANS